MVDFLKEAYTEDMEATAGLIEAHLHLAKETNDITTLARSLAAAANLERYMNQTQNMIFRVLCQRYTDWVANLRTGK